MIKKSCLVFVLAAALLSFFGSGIAEEPSILWLRILDKPNKEMSIHWISDEKDDSDKIRYRKRGKGGWSEERGRHEKIPFTDDLIVHHVTLKDLKEDKEYEFVVSDGDVHWFKTLPDKFDKTIRFIAGGDVYGNSLDSFGNSLDFLKEINVRAANYDPMFIMFGGDLTYGPEQIDRWLAWLRSVKEELVTNEGRMIPIITILGNHDTPGTFGDDPKDAKVYYTLFPTPDSQGYHVVDVGDYMSIFVLDSGHTHSIEGDQASWLKSNLKSRKDRPLKYALYHVPAYPGARDPDSGKSDNVRETWVPYFEKYGLTAAFENHDHVYKRTCRIKDNKEDDDGVLYLGDGCWTVLPREPNTPEEVWYLRKALAERHFIFAKLQPDKHCYMAITPAGECIDKLVEEK